MPSSSASAEDLRCCILASPVQFQSESVRLRKRLFLLLPILLQPLRVLLQPLVLLFLLIFPIITHPSPRETDALSALAVLARAVEEEGGDGSTAEEAAVHFLR